MTTKYYCNIGLGKHLEKKILNKYLDVLTLEKMLETNIMKCDKD